MASTWTEFLGKLLVQTAPTAVNYGVKFGAASFGAPSVAGELGGVLAENATALLLSQFVEAQQKAQEQLTEMAREIRNIRGPDSENRRWIPGAVLVSLARPRRRRKVADTHFTVNGGK